MTLVDQVYGALLQYGYLGAFLSAFLSHLVPFIAVPYLAIVWMLATVPGLNPLVVGVLSGVGAGLGKISSYYVGAGGCRVVGEDRRRELEALRGLVKDYAALLAFLAAATPIPDDVVLITVGMIGYPLWKYLASTIAGKVLLCSIVSLAASKISVLIWAEGDLGGTLAAVAAMLALAYLVLKVNWCEVASTVEEGGWRGLIDRVRSEGFRWVYARRGRSRRSTSSASGPRP